MRLWLVCFLVLLVLLVPAPGWAGLELERPGGLEPASSELPLLESYTFELGGWPQVELSFLDPRIERGQAQFRCEIRPSGRDASRIRLEVFRHVRPDSIQFALLLEQVRLEFLDAAGAPVKTIVLDEVLGEGGLFILGDSSDGYYQYRTTVSGLQRAERLRIQLLGNYE